MSVAEWMSQSPEAGDVVSLQSAWQFLVDGGPVMIPIGFCSVLALGFALERYARLTRRRVLPPELDEAVAAVHQGDFARAEQLATSVDAPALRILAAGLRRRGFTTAEVESAIQDQGQKEIEKLRGNIRWLNVVSNIAPLLGLFGTVVGIYQSFVIIAKAGMGKPELLAEGIGVALITTIGGLMVAIPTMLIASHLTAKVRRLVAAIDDKVAGVVEKIAGDRTRGATDAA